MMKSQPCRACKTPWGKKPLECILKFFRVEMATQCLSAVSESFLEVWLMSLVTWKLICLEWSLSLVL